MFHFLKFFSRIYNRLFSKEKVFIKRLRGLIGFTPANLGIFKLAFYHKSTTSDKLYAIQSNERLEYLGDAVLATIVAEYLFQKYPNSDEGFLTKMRSKIVKRYSLNVIADKMGLDVFLNQYNNTRLSRSMLGNALEALVGAIYLEKGYNSTKKFVINKILLGYLDIHELESFDDNYKSQLLEWCQKNGKTVSYKMVSKYKFEKRDRFKVAVLIDGEKLAVADDFNKKSAEQSASERAMQILGILVKKEDAEGGKTKDRQHRGRGQHKPREARDSRSKNKRPDSRRGDRKPRDLKSNDRRKPAVKNENSSRPEKKESRQRPPRKTESTQKSKTNNSAEPQTQGEAGPKPPKKNVRRNPNRGRSNRPPRNNNGGQNRKEDVSPTKDKPEQAGAEKASSAKSVD